jgi:hypothetical protein
MTQNPCRIALFVLVFAAGCTAPLVVAEERERSSDSLTFLPPLPEASLGDAQPDAGVPTDPGDRTWGGSTQH